MLDKAATYNPKQETKSLLPPKPTVTSIMRNQGLKRDTQAIKNKAYLMKEKELLAQHKKN